MTKTETIKDLVDALRRIGNRRMWRNLNGELVWVGDDGNNIETEDPRDIANTALKNAKPYLT